MSNFDKIVKLACKPKNAPPKAKYVDTLIAATFSDDGSLNDIIRSLSLRLREPNAVVVFKGLLTLHQMIRSGSTDNLLQYLSQGDQLRLRNVSGQNWEGYSPPSSMGQYAMYLKARITAYSEVKHDLVRAQTESNRRSDGLSAGSKARRLRHLPVEKGLLREVRAVQNVLDALVQCRFYDDNLQDENTVLAFRMLVKDLLVLFQAGNEGVCNILEHYFEMSKPDATDSFQIYKRFISQTDKVVDYLGVARKLNNVVNVPVPNLKHAPTGLVKALEEYLNDPNFEQNRSDYKKNLGVVEGRPTRTPSPSQPAEKPKVEPKTESATSSSLTSAPTVTTPPATAPPGSSQKIQDFFDSIQTSQQPSMFGGPGVNGFNPQMQQMQMQMTGMQQGAAFNPFRQSMMMMPQQTGFMAPQMTGFPMQQQPQQQQAPMQMQMHQPQPQHQGGGMEFLAPQMTGAMAFGNRTSMYQPQQQQQQQSQQAFIQPQQTGFLQPQGTGSNPFRQSMMINTAMPTGAMSQPASPFGGGHQASFASQIARPGSTPTFGGGAAGTGSGDAKPLSAQPTGSKNPFAPAGGVPQLQAAQQPKAPSMAELAFNRMQAQQTGMSGGFGGMSGSGNAGASPWGSLNGKSQPQQQHQQQQQQGSGGMTKDGQSGTISSVASSFAFDGSSNSNNTGSDFLSQFGSLNVSSHSTGATSPTFGSLSGQTNNTGNSGGGSSAFSFMNTGATSPGSTGASEFLQPQRTGFGGSSVKPFKPTSSFGSQLMSELPALPENGPMTSPSASATGGGASGSGGFQPQSTGFPGMGASTGGAGGSGQTGGQQQQQQQQQFFGGLSGLSAQQTGMANPFRQSMMGGGGGVGGATIGGNGGNGFGGMGNAGPIGQWTMPSQQQQQHQQSGGGMGSLI